MTAPGHATMPGVFHASAAFLAAAGHLSVRSLIGVSGSSSRSGSCICRGHGSLRGRSCRPMMDVRDVAPLCLRRPDPRSSIGPANGLFAVTVIRRPDTDSASAGAELIGGASVRPSWPPFASTRTRCRQSRCIAGSRRSCAQRRCAPSCPRCASQASFPTLSGARSVAPW